MRRVPFMLLPALILALAACDRNMVYDQYRHIDDASWSWDDTLRFDFPFTDTTGEYNILVQLRHSTDYPLSNLYMFVDILGPSGRSIHDTIQFILAAPDGKWLGKGNGKIRELSYLYRKRTRFPEPGDYSIFIEQAMRVRTVPVNDVGIRIEKYTPK